jgi:methionyl-tRNA synthetase
VNVETKNAPNPAPAAAPPTTPAAPEGPVPAPANPEPELVGIEAFGALDFRTAKVTAAERIKGAKKLLKLQLDVGGVPRQIVSGIAEAYEPEQLVGRTIIIVANLKPAKLMGVESHGMLLAATVDGKAVLAGFERDVPSGTRVK